MPAENEPVSGDEPLAESSSRGFAWRDDDPEGLRRAVDIAFDYRGDVTLELRDGRSIDGYVFNRDFSAEPAHLDLFPAAGGDRLRVSCDDIRGLSLTGKDMASGKSWEAWVAKWNARKAAEASDAEDGPPG